MKKVFVCDKCGSRELVGQSPIYRPYNKPLSPAQVFDELILGTPNWCYDCMTETVVIKLNSYIPCSWTIEPQQ